MKEYHNYSLLRYNTIGINVHAARFVEYVSLDELVSFLSANEKERSSFLQIGGGSNLLFTSDYSGTILHSAIKGYEITGQTKDYVEVCVGASEVWDDFVSYAVSCGWYGAENLSLIPGEVGASAVQNIGAYGVEVKDLIRFVDAVCIETGDVRRFSAEECQYAYRSSVFKKELKNKYIVTHVTYRLSKHPLFRLDYGNIRTELEKEKCELTLDNIRRLIIKIREAKLPDPKRIGNAGSFFMNPFIEKSQYEVLLKAYPDMPCYPAADGLVKIPAGWLIERCGWKGKSLGRAGVYEKQALVLVNRGEATGEEVVRLAKEIIRSVEEKFGITIKPEVNII